MAVNSYDPVTGRPIFLDTDAPDIKVDPSKAAEYAADVGNRIVRANKAALDAYPYKRAGLAGRALDTRIEYIHNGTTWEIVIEPELRPTTVTGGTVDAYGGIVPQTGATTVRVNGVFSPRFRIYRVQFWLALSTSSGGIGLNLTVGGAVHNAANHWSQRLVASGTSVTASSTSGVTTWSGTGVTGSNLSGEWMFRNPASTGIKSFSANAAQAPGVGMSQESGWLGNVDASVFDGFQFTASAGNFVGGFIKVQPQG